MRHTLLLTIGLAMAALTCPPARSAGPGEPEWQVRQSPEGVVLAYEVPDTDDQILFIGCEADSGRLAIRLRYERNRAPEGLAASVMFGSQTTSLVIPMWAERQGPDHAMMLLATVPLPSPLLEVLGGGMLLIDVGGENNYAMQLEGAEPGVAAIEARCGAGGQPAPAPR